MLVRILPIVCLLLLPSPVWAQESATLEDLRLQEMHQESLNTMGEFAAKVEARAKARRLDCTQAVGYAPFCDCIMEDIPYIWSFTHYIGITTRTKAENGYDELDDDFKKAYDHVIEIRDRCVRQINSKP